MQREDVSGTLSFMQPRREQMMRPSSGLFGVR
jgi:hypothetical protein